MAMDETGKEQIMAMDETPKTNEETRASSRLSRRTFVKATGLAAGATAMTAITGLPAGAATRGRLPEVMRAGPPAGIGGKTGKKVIFTTHDNNSFFPEVQIGCQVMAGLRGWHFQFLGKTPQPPASEIIAIMEDAIAAGPQAIGFTRIDDHSYDSTIERALRKGIKVVLYNVASPGYEALGVGFVGQDFIPAGRTAGQQIAAYAQKITGRKSGIIECEEIAAGNSALTQRIEGTQQGIAAYNKANGTSYTTDILVASTDVPTATGLINAKWEAQGDKIVGWACADFASYIVADWAVEHHLTGKFAVGGFDLNTPVLYSIRAGTSQYTIGQNPYAQGFVTSAFLDMEMEAGYPGFTYDTGAEVVNASNIKAVIKREAKFATL